MLFKNYPFRFLLSLILVSSLLFQNFYLSLIKSKAEDTSISISEQTVSANLNIPDPSEGLIAILIDQENYKKTQITEILNTYADTLSKNLPQTKSMIISVSREEKPIKIASLLENLYREEGLIGTIIVGEVPVPILKKEDLSFPSIFPYIDFDSKLWVYDAKVGAEDFFLNDFSDNKEPEIFAGVIKPPYSLDSSEYDSALALFLTKITNYHNGANPAEKKISFLDTINRPILGEASGTTKDYIDQTITAILQMGRYDLNFYELNREEQEKLEDCGKGFIPATIKVVKAISKIRPWEPETLKYLLTPLIYIPPIPLEINEPEKISLPEVPDLGEFTNFTTNVSCISKLPNPKIISDLKDTIPAISRLAEIDPSNLLKLKDAIPKNPLPSPNKINNIIKKVDAIVALNQKNGYFKKAHAENDLFSELSQSLEGLENIPIPDINILDSFISEIESGIPGPPTLPKQEIPIPEIDSQKITEALQVLEQVKTLENIEIPNLEQLNLEELINSELNLDSFSQEFASLTDNLTIPEIPFSLQKDITESLSQVTDKLNNLGFTLDDLELVSSQNKRTSRNFLIPKSTAKIEIPTFDLNSLTPTLAVLGSLPALPKMPELPKLSWTVEVPPPFVPIVLPGLPSVPAINLMSDFYILPLDMIVPPPPIPPTGFVSRLKSVLKIPDLPEIPKIPEAPDLSAQTQLLEKLCEMPDFSPIENLTKSSFLKDLQAITPIANSNNSKNKVYASMSNLDKLVELTEIVDKPEFKIIEQISEIDLDGIESQLNNLEEVTTLKQNLEKINVDSLTQVKDSLINSNLQEFTSKIENFKAENANPEVIQKLKQQIPDLKNLREIIVSLGTDGKVLGVSDSKAKENINSGKVLGISTTNYTSKLTSISDSLGSVEKLKEKLPALTTLMAPLADLQGQIAAISSFGNITENLPAINETLDQVKKIGDITAPLTDFQTNFEELIPEQAKKNLESLKNIGQFPEPDLMSIVSLNVTGYTPPTDIKMPKLDNINNPLEVTGDTSKTILNQDIYKNLLPPSKQAWAILCESNGSEFEDLDKLIEDTSYYNKTDIQEIDREPGVYDRQYMEKYFRNLVNKPNANLNKQYFLENLVPGITEIAVLNAKGETSKIDLGELTIEIKDITSSKSLITLLNGGAYGDITKEDYLAGHQLFKGETLSLITFTGLNLGNSDEPIDIGSSQSFGFGIYNDAPFLSVMADGSVSTGKALQPFQLESQILLGDPTIKLTLQQKNNDNDYSITFGETIPHFYSGKNLIVSADFNSDGNKDIISVNSLNGDIQLLKGSPESVRSRFLNEGIIYKFKLPEIDLEKVKEIDQKLDDPTIPEDKIKELKEEKEKSLEAKILKVSLGDFDDNQFADLAINYLNPSEDGAEKIDILLNDGKSNFKIDPNINFKAEKVEGNSEEKLPENIIAYQFGENPFSTETRFKMAKNDFDNDGDEDIIFSTDKQLQFKENLKNGKTEKTKLNKPHLFKEMINLEAITKPIDIKEIVANEGYAEISWYPSYIEDLAGYNVYFSQDSRFLFEKKQIVPLSNLNNPLSPEYKLYGLENDKRVYVTITAYTNDGKETTVSQILQTTPRIEADEEAPIAVIKAKNEVLINSLNDYSASNSIENSKHLTYSWDFDLATDTNGDGDPTNDQNSNEEKPAILYDVLGTYKIGLEIKDLNNNVSKTTHEIDVVLPSNLVISLEDGLVLFLNEMSPNLNVKYYKIPEGNEEYNAEIVAEKTTDANGFVSFAPVINIPGSKIISKDTGEMLIMINTENELLKTELNNQIELRFDQTRISLKNDTTEFAKLFFVHDRNQDAFIVSSLQEITSNKDLNSGVFIEDFNEDDSFILKTGDSGSIRLLEDKSAIEKTYATILPSGGMYLDNSTFLELANEEKTEFVFNIRLKETNDLLAKILLKPLPGNSKISPASSFENNSPGIYIKYADDLLSLEDTSDFKSGDKLYAIVSDKIGNQSPETNIITLRKHHTTEDFNLETDVDINSAKNSNLEQNTNKPQNKNTGQVLGASTSRVNKYQQAINLNNPESTDIYSDSSPTLYGRVNRYNTDLFLSIHDETGEKVLETKIKTDRTGNFDHSLTRNLKEGIYETRVMDPNEKIIKTESFEIDLTPPEIPFVEGFDGDRKILGKTSPNSVILAYNYNSVFDPIATVNSDNNGNFLLEFPTSTSHFTLFATDQAGNKSEVKEVFYSPEGLTQKKEEEAIKDISNELENTTKAKNNKNPERFIGFILLFFGLATLIYNKKDELFPKY